MKRAFFFAIQILLFLTAIGKILGAISWSTGHAAKDPVIHFVSAREMLVFAAALELLVVAAIWRARSDTSKALAPLWLSLLFAGYRLESWRIHFTGYCSCFGYWSTWMHLSKDQVNLIAKSMIAFMLLGSMAIVVSEFLRRKKPADGAASLAAKPTP